MHLLHDLRGFGVNISVLKEIWDEGGKLGEARDSDGLVVEGVGETGRVLLAVDLNGVDLEFAGDGCEQVGGEGGE
jgi:hypothetical protein